MSLVVAFNLDDYAILATDKRGVLNHRNENKEDTVLNINDTYQKLRKILSDSLPQQAITS